MQASHMDVRRDEVREASWPRAAATRVWIAAAGRVQGARTARLTKKRGDGKPRRVGSGESEVKAQSREAVKGSNGFDFVLGHLVAPYRLKTEMSSATV
jgi:hypothetical protein